MTETRTRRAVTAIASRTRPTRRRIARHKRKWSLSAGIVFLIIAQMVWDVSANDIAAYFVPVFTKLLGAPPAP